MRHYITVHVSLDEQWDTTFVVLKQFAPNFHVVAEWFTCCTRIIYTKLSNTLLSQCDQCLTILEHG